MSEVFQQGLADAVAAIGGTKFRKPRPSAGKAALKRLLEAGSKGPQKASSAREVGEQPLRVQEEVASVAARGCGDGLDLSGFRTLDALRTAALQCERCPHLVAFRNGVVFGVGNPKADLMFVGEAPGADEDLQGEPFVGRAGQLLTKIIEAMGFTREDIYIANILKCRPDMPEGVSGNRKPKPDEMATCLPWLERQIGLIRPKAMVALGSTAVEGLLGLDGPIGKMRGQWQEFNGIPVMVTYHPAYLLRNQSIGEKRKVWEDMLLVLAKLGRPITAKQKKFFTASAGE